MKDSSEKREGDEEEEEGGRDMERQGGTLGKIEEKG